MCVCVCVNSDESVEVAESVKVKRRQSRVLVAGVEKEETMSGSVQIHFHSCQNPQRTQSGTSFIKGHIHHESPSSEAVQTPQIHSGTC